MRGYVHTSSYLWGGGYFRSIESQFERSSRNGKGAPVHPPSDALGVGILRCLLVSGLFLAFYTHIHTLLYKTTILHCQRSENFILI